MCDPLTLGIATGLLSVGGAVAEHVGTNQLAEATARSARLDYANKHNILQQQRVQLDQEKAARAEDTAIATAQAQGAVAASASSQGLGYASTSQALHAQFFGIGRQDSLANVNDLNQRAQLMNEYEGAAVARDSKIRAAPRSGLLNLGLGVGKGVLSGFNAANAYKKAA